MEIVQLTKGKNIGKMILYIVGQSMQNTRGRYLAAAAALWKWIERGSFVFLGLLLVLLLVGCSDNEDRERVSTPSGVGTVVVSTVEPTGEPPTAVPTVPPPTATPLPTPTPPAPLAALVNGQYVFLADYERQIAQYEQSLQEVNVDLESEEGQARLAQAQEDVLQSLIDGVLIDQAASGLGVTLGQEELEAQVAADIEVGGGQAAFDEWLLATGLTREDYERMLRQSMLAQRVWDVLTADVPQVAEQVHARHIVVGSEEEAEQILAQLKEGADFVALAREQSLDLATKDNGGDLGWFPRGFMAPELEQAAFALQPGGISESIALAGNYHVVQVVEREVDRPLSPEMVVHLKEDKFNRWLEELRAAAVIERFVGE